VIPHTFYWTLLREPITRCASHYQYQCVNLRIKESFESWIRRPEFRNLQCGRLGGEGSCDRAIRAVEEKGAFVGLVERFNESLLLLNERIGETLDITYRLENVASSSQIMRELLGSPRTLELLVDANREDVRLYRHFAEQVFPSAVNTYKGDLTRELGVLNDRLSQPIPWALQERCSEVKRLTLFKTMRLASMLASR